jgi:hypothetical protein
VPQLGQACTPGACDIVRVIVVDIGACAVVTRLSMLFASSQANPISLCKLCLQTSIAITLGDRRLLEDKRGG